MNINTNKKEKIMGVNYTPAYFLKKYRKKYYLIWKFQIRYLITKVYDA